MKNRLLTSVMASAVISLSPTSATAAVVFAESFGTISSTTAIAAHETSNGFDNDSFVFSGTADLRLTGTSSGYAGASGLANVFLTNATTPYFRIDGLSTAGYTTGSVGISFGAFKSATTSNMTSLILEYSTNGTNWTAVGIPTQPTGAGTSVWRMVSIPGTSIPISPTLSLRWTNSDATTQYRIDDLTLSAAVPEPSVVWLGACGVLGLLRRRRE